MNWIQVALDGYTWQDVIHTIMKLQVPRNSENFLNRKSRQHFEKDFVLWNMLCEFVRVWCACVRARAPASEGTVSCIFNFIIICCGNWQFITFFH